MIKINPHEKRQVALMEELAPIWKAITIYFAALVLLAVLYVAWNSGHAARPAAGGEVSASQASPQLEN